MPRVTFEKFMERALYDPARGYYSRRITAVGRNGDFTTAPMLSDALARAIAHWATSAMRESGCRDLIEVGPGEGVLAAQVVKNLPWDLRWRTRLRLVETSAPLASHQRALLGKRAIWQDSISDALAACGGNAVIYSNELVDAFPVRRFQKTALGWQELAVEIDNDNATESLLSPASLPDSSGFLEAHPSGQWIEIHDSYRRHLTTWLPFWKSGRLLTIDYGALTENLYHRRPHGSIRAYLLQQKLEGFAIYQNPGRQDLTADVNFTDLIHWSQPWTRDHRLMTMREFLSPISNLNSQIDLTLSDSHGAGDAFLVLDQAR